MAFDLKDSPQPEINRALKIIQYLTSDYGFEPRAAANRLRNCIASQGFGLFEGLGKFKSFFKSEADYAEMKRRAVSHWLDLGYIRPKTPPPAQVFNDFDRFDPNANPGPGYTWVAAHPRTSSTGRVYTVRGFWMWIYEGYVPKPAPTFDKFNRNIKPGDNYCWVRRHVRTAPNGFGYLVRGHWRLKPGCKAQDTDGMAAAA